MKLHKEVKHKDDITPEEQAMIDRGDALAIELKQPTMSGTMYTVALAIFVAVAFMPIWVAPTTFMWTIICGSAMAWLTLYKMASNAAANIFNAGHIQQEISAVLIDILQKRLKEQEDTDGELSGD